MQHSGCLCVQALGVCALACVFVCLCVRKRMSVYMCGCMLGCYKGDIFIVLTLHNLFKVQ